jgi:hypothetical protein
MGGRSSEVGPMGKGWVEKVLVKTNIRFWQKRSPNCDFFGTL